MFFQFLKYFAEVLITNILIMKDKEFKEFEKFIVKGMHFIKGGIDGDIDPGDKDEKKKKKKKKKPITILGIPIPGT